MTRREPSSAIAPRLALACLLAGGAALDAPPAQGATCGVGTVLPSSQCTEGLSGFTADSAGALDAGRFFGLSDWVLLQKLEDFDEATDRWVSVPGALAIGLTAVPALVDDLRTGGWAFDPDVWDAYGSVAVVLKGGSNGGAKWAAFALEPGTAAGTWDTGRKALSHLSVYGAAPVPPPVPPSPLPVPEPGTLALVAAGLLGLVGWLRRAP
ncbi:MAG: PEP-CTERM sorting domain-containing protein [Deferrisomatales bacterium]